MNIAFEQSALEFQELDLSKFAETKIRLTIARLDKLHADISGNKLFKLHYFLEEALASTHKKILTFGGAYSNHLVATAFAGKELGLNTIGIVRREEHENNSHSLQRCTELGMKLVFISRSAYRQIADPAFISALKITHGESTVIPEGGYHSLGAKGAALIMSRLASEEPTHVCVPVGTATTLAGLVSGASHEKIVGVPVLKNMKDIPARINEITGITNLDKLVVLDGYHFGGYARSSPELVAFMNIFFETFTIPLDFVYTAKMMYAIIDKIKQGYFPDESHIVCLHTGGLQGNKSLHPYNLTF